MNILVAMKSTPDLTQVRISNRRPVFDNVEMIYGDLDKSALEAALQIAGDDDHVTVIGVGGEDLEEGAKEGLAMGAENAILAADEEYENLDGAQVAALLADIVNRTDDVELVLMGEGSGDGYSGLVPGRVAEILGWPSIGAVSSVKVEDGKAVCTRAKDETVETLEAPLPAIISVAGEAATPHVPPISQILKAGRKPKEVLESDDFDIELPEGDVSVIDALAPENNRAGEVLESIDELIDLLKSKNLL